MIIGKIVMRSGTKWMRSILGAFLITAEAGAATYIVDQNNSHSDDANSGTIERPWKTLSHGARQVRAGDTVYVMEGIYAEKIAPANSGMAGKRITFRSVPRRAVTIKGVDTSKCNYLTIEGFKITETEFGVRIASDHVEIFDNYFEAIRKYPINGKGDGVTVAYNEIYHSQFGIVTGGSNWRVENNEVRRLFDYGELGDCDYCRPFGEHQVFRFNFFHGTKREEIGKAHVDCFQVFDVNGEVAQHTVIEHNVGFDFHQAFMAEGKYHPGNVSDFTFRKNVFSSRQMGAWGLCVVEVPRVVAINNTFADIFYHGIGFSGERANGGLARNNIFAHLRTSYWADKTVCDGDHNLVFDCRPPGKVGASDLIDADPRFVESEKGNYRLRMGSAAIRTGIGSNDIGGLEFPNVYFIDPRHPGASDDFFGYAGWPFKTLATACRVAAPGETIVLRGGIYREVMAPLNSSVAIRAMDGEKVILSGANLVQGWRREGDIWTAPLESTPKLFLKDGRDSKDFKYDTATKRISVQGIDDPRLHVFETIVRTNAIDCSGKEAIQIEGIEITNVLSRAVLGRPRLNNVTVNGK